MEHFSKFIIPGIIAVFTATILAARSWVLNKIRTEVKERRALEVGVRSLLRVELSIRFNEIEARGHMLDREYIELQPIYDAYKMLGGNGSIEARWNKLQTTIRGI